VRPAFAAAALLIAPLLLAGPGCQGGPRPQVLAGPAEAGSPFSPVQMRLHPLSRVDRTQQGAPLIVAYLELRDAWGHNTKAIGELQVLLYRAAPGVAEDVQELKWDINLSDLDRNSRLFDPVTHMYRLPLLDPPAWVAPEAGRPTPRIRLRLILSTFAPDGAPRMLEHDGGLGG
jgi:hypothetical protein